MKLRSLFYYFSCLGIVFLVFRNWFLNSLIIGGDWPYYYGGFLKSFSIVPILWAPWQGNGLGGVNPLLGLHIFSSLLIVPFVNWIGLPWVIVYKVGWFGLFLLFSFLSPVVLWRSAFPHDSSRWPAFLAGLIYTTNTYTLMVTGGGQMGVALAYALAPLVLGSFIKFTVSVCDSVVNVKSHLPAMLRIASQAGTSNVKYGAVTGVFLGVQLMIDPRIAYGTMVGVSLYIVCSLVRYFINKKEHFFQVLFSTFFVASFSVVIAALFNAFWIVPMVIMRSNPIGDLGLTYTSIDSIKFFSFADFSHAIALLHPNWPENVFGKTYFLQAEFLILPFVAFFSLLYWRKDKNISFFALLGLIGVFLAKGAQEPFGMVYQWMFTHVPGFMMFRDPTKWYVLIAISYSVLIPFTLRQLAELRIRGKSLLITLFILFWLLTIRQVALGKLGGTFEKHTVPQEYRELEHFLEAQQDFVRTLWVPRQQRFTYGTLDHMPVEAEPLFGATTAAELKVILDKPMSKDLLEDLGIGYVMIPYDSLGELFLTDRKYDEKKRKEYETVLDGVAWLTKIRSGDLTVYQTPQHRDLFWISTNEALNYKRLRPDRYTVSFTVREPETVYFSQTYHSGWVLRAGKTIVKSQRSPQGLNSFQIQRPGIYEGIVEFEPQKYVTLGMFLSVLTVAGVVLAFMLPKKD